MDVDVDAADLEDVSPRTWVFLPKAVTFLAKREDEVRVDPVVRSRRLRKRRAEGSV